MSREDADRGLHRKPRASAMLIGARLQDTLRACADRYDAIRYDAAGDGRSLCIAANSLPALQLQFRRQRLHAPRGLPVYIYHTFKSKL